jgi:hypothetical protein
MSEPNTNTTEEFVLTDDNYYSDEANAIYLSNSTFKNVYGHPAHPHPCEAAAIYGEKIETDALIIGSYVDAYFEGKKAFEEWCEKNKDKIYQKNGKPYQMFKDADAAIQRVEKDPVFMKYVGGGNHQTIMTGEIAGHKFKIKMDAYHPGEMIVDLKYVKSAGGDWNDTLKKHTTFIEEYGYAIQGAIYQEIVYQNTGLRLPFFIGYITKEKVTDVGPVPDFDVIELPQEMLDEALEFVKIHLTAKPYNIIKANPKACGKRSCPYCRDRKTLTGPTEYAVFEQSVCS